MRIAITTPTGNIGRQLVAQLQKEGEHDLVLLARNADKLKHEQAAGATVVEGDLADAEYVTKATAGADALFWVNPPSPTVDDFPAHYRRLSESGATAAKTNKIDHVVLISSIGAHLGKGVGPVNAFVEVESIFRKATDNLTILRPAYFMENLMMTAGAIVEAGSVFLPIRPEASTPMIATADIAECAARVLNDGPQGIRIMPLHGPRDYSFGEAASTIGDALSTKVKYVQIADDQARDAMVGMGMSPHVADLMLELQQAIDSGYMKDEFPRTQQTTTPTTLEQFSRDVLVPMIKSQQ